MPLTLVSLLGLTIGQYPKLNSINTHMHTHMVNTRGEHATAMLADEVMGGAVWGRGGIVEGVT